MTTRSRLLASAAILAAQSFHVSAVQAQDTFLGTIVLGESRRGVQTDTATTETVISQEELDARQASTMAELLDSVPNVTLVNGGLPQGAAVTIRGLGAWGGVYGTEQRVAVVVDGVKSEQEEIYRNGSLFALEPELFREISVQRGPAEGFAYGSGSVGGTIIAETKDAVDFLEDGDNFSIRQKIGYESNGNGAYTSTIVAWAPDDRFDMLAFYGYRTVDDREDGDGTVQDATAFNAPSALLKANYQLNENSKLTFSVAYNEIPEYDVPYNAYDPDWGDTTVDRYTRDATAFAAYSYNPVDNDLIDFEARLTYKLENMRISNPSSGSTSGLYNSDNKTESVSLQLRNEAFFQTGIVSNTLTAGAEFKTRERSSVLLDPSAGGTNYTSAPGGTDDSFALYVTNKMEIGSGLTITPQLRYESQTLTSENNTNVADGTEFDAEATTGALSARYEFSNGFAVFATAAYNENLPILDDIASSTFANNAEKATTYEIGASYDAMGVLSSNDILKAKITAFDTHMWDLSSLGSSISTADLDGFELEVSYVHPNFYADLNYGVTRGTINGTDDYFNYAPADSLQLTVGKRFMDDQLDLAMEIAHSWANNRTSEDPDYAYANSSLVPSEAHTTLAVTASYKPNSGPAEGVEFRASIENLTDATYKPYLATRNAPGRNFKFSIAKTF